MIWKLLRHNISVWQLVGYGVATLAGLAIVLTAIQFYVDLSDVVNDDEGSVGLFSSQNIVVSKPVTVSSSLRGATPSFSPADIAEIESQPWAGGVAPFQAADFGVWASVDIADRGMSTALFLESVPDDALDVLPDGWGFDDSNPLVPIIISKDYLQLYNFGFAASGRMPMVSEGMLSAVPLRLTLSGRGGRATLPGRIVGYSSELNTIAVPQSFMDWAHARFGSDDTPSQPSRIIIKVKDPSDVSIEEFLASRGYERAGGSEDLGRAAYFLKFATTTVASVGGVITLLALGILVLSLYLLVQKNRRTISGLLLLGYSPADVSRCYEWLLVTVNASVTTLSVLAVWLVSLKTRAALGAIGIEGGPLWPTILAGAGIALVLTYINICVVRRLCRKCF